MITAGAPESPSSSRPSETTAARNIVVPASTATPAVAMRAHLLMAVCLRFSPMRVLVTGGAGFIGSHFAKRLVAAGEDVAVLDKLTYSGNRANLEGAEIEFFEGDICDPDAVAEAGAGAEAIVNFAAETHVDRSIL